MTDYTKDYRMSSIHQLNKQTMNAVMHDGKLILLKQIEKQIAQSEKITSQLFMNEKEKDYITFLRGVKAELITKY